jgi:cullin-associated NEDD8-dissociated protein 1
MPDDLQDTLVDNLLPYLTPSDPTLLLHSLELLTFLLRSWPKTWFAPTERKVLARVYPLACEPLLLPSSLDALLGFVYALAEADGEIAGHLVGGLKIAFEKSAGGVVVAGNVSKCLGAVVMAQRPIAAGTISEFAKHIKVCVYGFFGRAEVDWGAADDQGVAELAGAVFVDRG